MTGQSLKQTTPKELFKVVNAVKSAIDLLAPLKSFPNSVRHPQTAWFSPELRVIKRQCKNLERRWRRSHDERDKERFKIALSNYHKNIKAARKASIASQLARAENAPKTLFQILKSFTSPKACDNLEAPSQALCDNIAQYFTQKIELIYDKFTPSGNLQQDATPFDPLASGKTQLLESFPPMTAEVVEALLHSVKSGSPLDVIPAKVVASLSSQLSSPIGTLLNLYERGLSPSGMEGCTGHPYS